MKKIRVLFMVSILAVLLFAGCSGDKQTIAEKEDLLTSHKFTIASVNGMPFTSMQERPQFIQFDKDMQITGQVCNFFTGTATLKGDFLQVSTLTSTNMLCSDEVNAIEQAFFAILQQGAVVTVGAETLTLSSQSPAEKTAVEGDKSVPEDYVFVLHRENSIAE